MKYARLVTVAILALSTACSRYRGDGEFVRLSRTYVPVIGVNRGYMITMPNFVIETDHTLSYELAALPRKNASFVVEMVIYWPPKPMSREEQRALDVSVPAVHTVEASLIDKRSGKVLAERISGVNELPNTNIVDFGRSPCIKNLLTVNNDDIPQCCRSGT